MFKIGDLELDSYNKMVRRAGREVILSAKEFSMLELLIKNKNKVLSRSYIAEAIWGVTYCSYANLIDVYINSLRLKIDKEFDCPLIHTVIGNGYLLKIE